MLGHRQAVSGQGKGDDGRDVERAQTVAAGAATVCEGISRHRDGCSRPAQGAPAISSAISPLIRRAEHRAKISMVCNRP